jgi:DNA-binding FadR family transcriptional regulator
MSLLFDTLVRDIVSGVYPPGANLPAERELAAQLGASRPTLREALRRLSEWGLVEARRGSGVTVRHRREWAIDVLPAYLAFGAAAQGPQALGQLVQDLLAVRRSLLVEVVRIVGPRLGPGSLAAAHAHVEAAWAARDDVGAFVREDFAVIRALVEAAQFLPALWMLGSLSGVYESIATRLSGAASAPRDYLASWRGVLDALEAGRVAVACEALGAYLLRHDKRLLSALGLKP